MGVAVLGRTTKLVCCPDLCSLFATFMRLLHPERFYGTKTPGVVGAFFPFWNSSDSLTTPILVLSFHTLTNCKSCSSFVLIFIPNCRGVPSFDAQTLRTSGSSNNVSTYPLSIQTLAHSFALKKISTPFFSIDSALFAKNHPGWGRGYSTSLAFGRSDFRTFRRVPHFPKSAIFSIP
jgi:hypothetical protein